MRGPCSELFFRPRASSRQSQFSGRIAIRNTHEPGNKTTTENPLKTSVCDVDVIITLQSPENSLNFVEQLPPLMDLDLIHVNASEKLCINGFHQGTL